jgi:hypothetical protein
MPSTGDGHTILDRLATQRNVTIATAIAVAIPAAYGFHVAFGAGTGDFLLLLAVAVGVPTAMDQYWRAHGRLLRAAGETAVGAVAVAATFLALYVLGTDVLSLSPFPAAVLAFLVADLGPLAALALVDASSGRQYN